MGSQPWKTLILMDGKLLYEINPVLLCMWAFILTRTRQGGGVEHSDYNLRAKLSTPFGYLGQPGQGDTMLSSPVYNDLHLPTASMRIFCCWVSLFWCSTFFSYLVLVPLTAASSIQAWKLLLHSSDLNIIVEEADDDGGGDDYSCKMYVASWAHHKIRKLGLPARTPFVLPISSSDDDDDDDPILNSQFSSKTKRISALIVKHSLVHLSLFLFLVSWLLGLLQKALHSVFLLVFYGHTWNH